MSQDFKKIGIIGKYANTEIGSQLCALSDYLLARGCEVHIDQGTVDALRSDFPNANNISREDMGQLCDLIIVVGGDGTLLNAARSLTRFNVPLVGINLGHLGFLTDIPWDHYQDKLDEIFDGQYTVEDRMLLQANIIRDGTSISESIAFNDVIVHKWEEARMLEFSTTINGKFVNVQRSDGIIVSTPTGSTAYALSGGGPVLNPALKAILLVPICPHTLTQRPLVVDSESVIEITISEEGHARAQVTCDGQINLGVTAGDKIRVSQFNGKVTLLHPQDYNYYQILRTKLHWGIRL
ncbi:MAG: NAD(+) kinase [Gammaproteobacteria bacterium]|nr:NAD(+) kinase [Gammaproteobacteria bacterium]